VLDSATNNSFSMICAMAEINVSVTKKNGLENYLGSCIWQEKNSEKVRVKFIKNRINCQQTESRLSLE
jgi:oligoribonuclease (3'-5' exoribonuclease)